MSKNKDEQEKAKKLYSDFKRLAKDKRNYMKELILVWEKNGLGIGEGGQQILHGLSTMSAIYEVCAKKVKQSFLF